MVQPRRPMGIWSKLMKGLVRVSWLRKHLSIYKSKRKHDEDKLNHTRRSCLQALQYSALLAATNADVSDHR